MKSLWLGSAALVAIIAASSAGAADLSQPVYKAPPSVVPPVYNWTGFYLGVNAGGAWGTSDITGTLSSLPAPANDTAYEAAESPNLRPDGFTGGAQAGFNWQSGNVVFGLEADFGYFGLNGSQTTNIVPSGPVTLTATVNNSLKTDWLFTARPRIGWANNNWLVYATGGLAMTDMKFNSSFSDTAGETEAATFDKTKAGWTAGGGVEVAFAGNWSAKLEYLYADFGSVSVTDPVLLAGVPESLSTTHDVSLHTQIVRAGLNYRFDWGAPVVSRY